MNQIEFKNKIELTGNIGKDPEVRQSNGYKFVSFSIAVKEKVWNGDGFETHWYNVITRGEAKEDILNRLRVGESLKGRLVEISGKLHTRSFADASGTKRTITQVIAFGIVFYPKRIPGETQSTSFEAFRKSPQNETFGKQRLPGTYNTYPTQTITEEDIPF